jgi:hypothetical protein
MCACIPKGRKNDFRNAEVIAEPCAAPDDEVCPHKDGCQLDLQALHRVRKRLSQAAYQHHQPDSCLHLPAPAQSANFSASRGQHATAAIQG